MSVSIVGYSLRAPSASTVSEFADALRNGKDLTTSTTRYPPKHLGLPPRQGRLWDAAITSFDASFFGLSMKQAAAMDPAIRMLLEVSYEALMDAEIDIAKMRGSATGVYVGHGFSDMMSHTTSAVNTEKTGYELVNGAHSMAANRLSYFYDLKGPSMTIDTACSSSLVALDRAVQDLKAGRVERALVAGLSLTLNPHKNATFNAFTMLSPTGRCYSFDERADGYCRSDGVACVILERGQRGTIVAGIGTNSDGHTPKGITYPSSTAQAALMRQVFEESGVDPASVQYHEAHGTGTIAGDREELAAIDDVMGSDTALWLGSVKSVMGHAECASGLMGLIKILLMYREERLLPNHDFRGSPHAPIQEGRLTVVTEAETWTPGVATLSNFGFGGSNAFVILAPPRKNSPPHPREFNFWATQRALGNACPGVERSEVVFVCNGQGSQWNGMGRDMIAHYPVFRETIERLSGLDGLSHLVELYEDGTQWMRKENSTIGIVTFQLALINLLKSEGVTPTKIWGIRWVSWRVDTWLACRPKHR